MFAYIYIWSITDIIIIYPSTSTVVADVGICIELLPMHDVDIVASEYLLCTVLKHGKGNLPKLSEMEKN